MQAVVAMAGYSLDYLSHGYKGDYYPRATAHALLPELLPDSDITVASVWESAALVAKYGKGKKAYFCQHYEPLFFDNPVDSSDAEATYSYGLTLIANSSWLQSRLNQRLRATGAPSDTVHLATNAIDPDNFNSAPGNRSQMQENARALRIISYGGRDAKWKGFLEMAMAVRAARALLPDVNLQWSVYGTSLLPPDNPITPYIALGLLDQNSLAAAYRQNDVLLSASWYESFPLFPIEAMASGLAVITTAYGTEDYAVDGENCLIVEPKNIDSITQAIVRLARDRLLLTRLASSAMEVGGVHNWRQAGSRMEEVLRSIAFPSSAQVA
ncbi:glycosyltransferase family 4 protein [Dyella japonica]|uniref:Glycosyl transferase family 1 domain-containing protein n=2 Tax=Dyella japonica TaxID=231455 RepID=A0A075JZC7_9GAMM|nr:glycosyltransferase family 4 protein [Dyella japonica]AIF47259.1 hypothetical protein HY57_08195 [Dyella japonica A8]